MSAIFSNVVSLKTKFRSFIIYTAIDHDCNRFAKLSVRDIFEVKILYYKFYVAVFNTVMFLMLYLL